MYNQQQGNQVYYDKNLGQYYTQPTFGSYNVPMANTNPFYNSFTAKRSYLDGFGANNNANTSVAANLVANRLPYEYNAPSIANLFSSMSDLYAPFAGNQQAQTLGNYFGGLLGSGANSFMGNAGSSGAGRFV